MEKIKEFVDAGLNLIFPPICELCDEPAANRESGYVCEKCRSDPKNIKKVTAPFCSKCGLPFSGEIEVSFECPNCCDLELSFDFARAAVISTAGILKLMHRFKYDGAVWIEPFFDELLQGSMKNSPEFTSISWDFIIPVPLHPVKKREREFNQAEKLARAVSKWSGISVMEDGLRRTNFTMTQTQLTRKERARNMTQVFDLGNSIAWQRKKVIILDDVLTTGATTSACAKVLRKAGCDRVGVWTVARGV